MFNKLFEKMKNAERPSGAAPCGSPEGLARQLCELLRSDGAVLENGLVRLPGWGGLSIRAEADQLTGQSAVLNFFLSCPGWDQQLYECCAAAGKDTEQAVGMAVGSFVFGMLSGLRAVFTGQPKCRLETEFDGKPHRWSVYQSDLVGMGRGQPQQADAAEYWDLLEPELKKRIGDRKICYVKVYGASVNREIVGECRINDADIPALGALIGEQVKNWDATQFASHKQFFFLIQDDDTCHPYPYTQAQITERVRTALGLFGRLLDEEDGYDRCEQQLAQALGDPHLSAELFSFIPEICALRVFPKLQMADEATFDFDGRLHSLNLTQLAGWAMIGAALDQILPGEELPRELLGKLVSVSSLWSVVCSAREQGSDITQTGGVVSTIYTFPDGYLPR